VEDLNKKGPPLADGTDERMVWLAVMPRLVVFFYCDVLAGLI
jgi:hypothetical protein